MIYVVSVTAVVSVTGFFKYLISMYKTCFIYNLSYLQIELYQNKEFNQ